MTPAREPSLLSVTVLNYNYGIYLPACLESILGQTYRDLEVIVIDDCSRDDSLKVLEPYRRDPRVRIVAHEKNVGFRGSLIEGTEVHSRGPFVSVVSADDVIRRADAFELLLRPMLQREDLVMSFSSVDRFWSDTGEIFSVHHSFQGDRTLEAQEAFRHFVADRYVWAMHSGTVLRKSAYDRCGGYARDITFVLDTAMWAMIAQEGAVHYCDQVLFGYRVHRNQMSQGVAATRQQPLELFRTIDRACDRAAARGWPVGSLREEAYRARPVDLVVQDAFNGRTRRALEGAWSCLRGRPRALVADPEIWACVVRALAGPRVYEVVRRAGRAVRRKGAG